ncbi:hypothetical protein [Lacunimicrobium album]
MPPSLYLIDEPIQPGFLGSSFLFSLAEQLTVFCTLLFEARFELSIQKLTPDTFLQCIAEISQLLF